MLYNQYSYRQWNRWPKETFSALLSDLGFQERRNKVTEEQIASYDANLKGTSAPETVFSSIRTLRKMFHAFEKLGFRKTNCDSLRILRKTIPRKTLLPILGPILGLDIYIRALKA
jgi:hypothetical protein